MWQPAVTTGGHSIDKARRYCGMTRATKSLTMYVQKMTGSPRADTVALQTLAEKDMTEEIKKRVAQISARS